MVPPPWWILNGVKPAGPEKDMGSYTCITFSEAQQGQFGIDADGKVLDQAKYDAALAALKEGGGQTAEIATPAPLPKLDVADAETLKALKDPIIIDGRDQNEIDSQKGGPAIEGSTNVPVNMNGVKQGEHPTTTEEYQKKLLDAGVLPDDKEAHIITHCGNGGRGGRAAAVLRELGYANAHNGGSPDNIRKAREGA